jgi:hypothetical protein
MKAGRKEGTSFLPLLLRIYFCFGFIVLLG